MAGASRRGFMTRLGLGAGGLAAAAGMTAGAARSGGCPFGFGRARAAPAAEGREQANIVHATTIDRDGVEPFYGTHQGGIVTPDQSHTIFATFDLTAKGPGDIVKLLRAWTDTAARLSRGQTAAIVTPSGYDGMNGKPAPSPAPDSGEALGLSPSRLTITFGFGPGLFVDGSGKDRYGLAKLKPEPLEPLPRFNGDQLQDQFTGGDLSVQVCANDRQVAFHALRQLVNLGYGTAQLRAMQTGFIPDGPAGQTPRNLMGFKDGTRNPGNARQVEVTLDGKTGRDMGSLDDAVWVAQDGPEWMRGGSYVVMRRIRIFLEHWDRMEPSFQDEVFGRHKVSGAPIGGHDEFDRIDLDATDADGNPVIAENSHIRLGAPSSNGGAQILRRSYAYNDGAVFTAERWPPWKQGIEYDAGLLFVCYQRDPRQGFTRIFEKMSKLDLLNQFTTHVGSGLFACPRGARPGEFIGQDLFATV